MSLLAADHGLKLETENDALDAMSCGLPACIFLPEDLDADFFDLKNGLAGAILQKFINYNFRIAIVVGADHGYGARVSELIRDHEHHACVRFFTSVAEAQNWLT